MTQENASSKSGSLFARLSASFSRRPTMSSSSVTIDSKVSGCPVVTGPSSGGGCPVVNPANLMPHSPNTSHPGQAKPLSTWRQTSTIPTANSTYLPNHQDAGTTQWMYPSEQMFYNAMKRKGWSPMEDDMSSVVVIHNAVNERAWREIRRWEEEWGESNVCGGPKLIKFSGKPTEYSPKARLLKILGCRPPFDRHDWIIDRCGKEIRYVIDFYNASPDSDGPVSVHLDVRPALDSADALVSRLKMQLGWIRSGRWYKE